MKYFFTVEVESSNTDDDQVVEDTIATLETVLPYMWDNVLVTSREIFKLM